MIPVEGPVQENTGWTKRITVTIQSRTHTTIVLATPWQAGKTPPATPYIKVDEWPPTLMLMMCLTWKFPFQPCLNECKNHHSFPSIFGLANRNIKRNPEYNHQLTVSRWTKFSIKFSFPRNFPFLSNLDTQVQPIRSSIPQLHDLLSPLLYMCYLSSWWNSFWTSTKT